MPLMAQLCTADAMGTSAGSTARISAVGAWKHGLTSTNHSSPGNSRRCMSSGRQLLHGMAADGSLHGLTALQLTALAAGPATLSSVLGCIR